MLQPSKAKIADSLALSTISIYKKGQILRQFRTFSDVAPKKRAKKAKFDDSFAKSTKRTLKSMVGVEGLG